MTKITVITPWELFKSVAHILRVDDSLFDQEAPVSLRNGPKPIVITFWICYERFHRTSPFREVGALKYQILDYSTKHAQSPHPILVLIGKTWSDDHPQAIPSQHDQCSGLHPGNIKRAARQSRKSTNMFPMSSAPWLQAPSKFFHILLNCRKRNLRATKHKISIQTRCPS